MKKKSIFLLGVVLHVQLTYAQDYFTVIKVSGNIVIERTGSSLGTGTSFAQNENLLFRIPESRAAVINPQRGRFLLTFDNLSEFRNSKSNFLPSAGKISTRNITTSPKVNKLEDYFEGNCVIFNVNKTKIDTAVFPLNTKKYFYISYDYKNKTINKKLAFYIDTLLINKNELFTVDGKVITDPQIKQMKLNYLEENETYESTSVCTFTPVFPDLKILSQEIKLIIDQMGSKTYYEKLNEISAFIREFYGKIDEDNLKRWLNEELGFKKQ